MQKYTAEPPLIPHIEISSDMRAVEVQLQKENRRETKCARCGRYPKTQAKTKQNKKIQA